IEYSCLFQCSCLRACPCLCDFVPSCLTTLKQEDTKARATVPEIFYCKAASVGPDVPLRSRLGPDALNSVFGSFSFGSIRKLMKQFCISSQFWLPQTTSFAGSGFHLLLAELSKWAIPTIRVPFGIGIGLARSYPSCQLKSHGALKIVS